MIKNVGIVLMGLMLAILTTACATTEETVTTNGNTNATAEVVNRTGPDDSEITSTTDAEGVRTETRVFRDNDRVSRVVVTTRNGRQTVRAYSTTGEEKEVSNIENALEATGDAIADAAGFVADKSRDAARATAEGAETVGEKTVEGAKAVGERAETVGEKTVEGAKTVGKKTVEGAKKVGKKVRDAVP